MQERRNRGKLDLSPALRGSSEFAQSAEFRSLVRDGSDNILNQFLVMFQLVVHIFSPYPVIVGCCHFFKPAPQKRREDRQKKNRKLQWSVTKAAA
jgi:hypothetical protein